MSGLDIHISREKEHIHPSLRQSGIDDRGLTKSLIRVYCEAVKTLIAPLMVKEVLVAALT